MNIVVRYSILVVVLRQPLLRTIMKTSTSVSSLLAVYLVVCTSVTTSDRAIGQQSLPQGYVAHPDVGFAYKLYKLLSPWTDAKNRCIEDGAQLALIDSPKKVEYVIRQMGFWIYAHVGIIRSTNDSGTWVASSTGSPLSSLPWRASYPDRSGNCACVNKRHNGLESLDCGTGTNFVCEIQISDGRITAAK